MHERALARVLFSTGQVQLVPSRKPKVLKNKYSNVERTEDICVVNNYEIGYANRGSDLCMRSHWQTAYRARDLSPERDTEMGLPHFNPERDSSKESHTRIKLISF